MKNFITGFVPFALLFSFGADGSVIKGPPGRWNQNTLYISYNTAACAEDEKRVTTSLQLAIDAWNGAKTKAPKLFMGKKIAAKLVDFQSNPFGLVHPYYSCESDFSNLAEANLFPAISLLASGIPTMLTAGIVNLNAYKMGAASVSNITDLELTLVMAHELGHMLGIAEDSSNPEDLMYFSVGNKTELKVTRGDKALLKKVYP